MGLIKDLKTKGGDPSYYFTYHPTLVKDLKSKSGQLK